MVKSFDLNNCFGVVVDAMMTHHQWILHQYPIHLLTFRPESCTLTGTISLIEKRTAGNLQLERVTMGQAPWLHGPDKSKQYMAGFLHSALRVSLTILLHYLHYWGVHKGVPRVQTSYFIFQQKLLV